MLSRPLAVLLAGAALFFVLPAHAEPINRGASAAGAVIARKAGEEVRFTDVAHWRYVDLQQDLLTGDVLRTNATGQLAILFSDRTQVRLGRNTSMLVKGMGQTADTSLELQSGTMWARAERGGQGLAIDTPAATAAIRGTDWSLSVDAGGKTSLIVLDGLVELRNDFGSVQVAKGEGAVASIGQAPEKIIIVNPKDREQMLVYLSLRGAFVWMPASTLPVDGMHRERQRIEARPAADRSGEDWLRLAEADISLTGREAAAQSLQQARKRGLSRSQAARADLVTALIYGAEKRYDEAARLFERASPGLDVQRRSIAAYGGYFARSMANPNHVEAAPKRAHGPYAALAEAWAAGFLNDINAAIGIVAKAERSYPDNSTLPAARAMFSMLVDDREQAKEAIDRALAINPDDPTALEARANYRGSFESDLKGAVADFRASIAAAPGSTSAWNGLGLTLSALGRDTSAEEAFKRSIALDPQDPVSHANLAILYLDQARMDEAKREVDAAVEAGPDIDMVLVARGRYYMQTGEMEKAMQDLLTGSTSNPGVSQAQMMLAAVHYETGNRDAGEQAIDNAERLDEDDPVISSFRTAIAVDSYDSDGALRHAREFLKRSRARGGHYGALSANQDAGSILNSAFRLQGLDAWGQYYGDVVFDPFAGSSYIDQTLQGSANPFVTDFSYVNDTAALTQNSLTFSSFLQGLMLDPHMLTSRWRGANLIRRPFLEGSIGGGFTHVNGETGWTGDAEVQAYSNAPFPISFFATAQWKDTPVSQDLVNLDGSFDLETELLAGTAYLTATPTPDDRFVAFVSHGKQDGLLSSAFDVPLLGVVLPLDVGRVTDDSATNAGVAWSHTFDYQNVLSGALFYTDVKSASSELVNVVLGGFPPFLIAERAFTNNQQNYIAAVNHMIGGDDLTWRYGVEGGVLAIDSSLREIDYVGGTAFFDEAEDEMALARVYVDALYEFGPNLKFQGSLFGSYLEGDDTSVKRLEPRAGIGWSPADGHLLRAGFMREGFDLNMPTLSPIGIVGLQSNQRSLSPDGYADTLAMRWEAEWTDRFFTAVDFQRQELDQLSISIPLSADSIDLSKGRIDRASLTANLALGHGFGLSATAAYTDSRNDDPSNPGYGASLPFVPETAGQIAVTWVNEANVKATLAANYTGKRRGDDEANIPLDEYWTLDAKMAWEPFDKRFLLELAAYNLLDETFEIAPSLPGWGRTFVGSFKVRF